MSVDTSSCQKLGLIKLKALTQRLPPTCNLPWNCTAVPAAHHGTATSCTPAGTKDSVSADVCMVCNAWPNLLHALTQQSPLRLVVCLLLQEVGSQSQYLVPLLRGHLQTLLQKHTSFQYELYTHAQRVPLRVILTTYITAGPAAEAICNRPLAGRDL